MEWRVLPPLSALRAFAAFAETRNVVAAGAALGVSHAAISQQLRALEGHLDVALLDRSARSLSLTAAGERLATTLRSSFAGMIEVIEDITGQQENRPLHISVTPTFAASWLMPRLPTFRQVQPDIDLRIDPTAAVVTLEQGGIDLAIRYGRGDWPGVEAEILLQSPMVVVAAPSLVGDGPVDDLAALADFPWLEENCTSESTNWLQKHGAPRARKGLMQVPGNLLLDGARDGQGIVVTVEEFVRRDLEAGRLRRLHAEQTPDSGYHIVTRPGVLRPAARAFIAWLRCEARISPVRS